MIKKKEIKKENILGYDVCTLTIIECVHLIFSTINNKQKKYLACFNPHSFAISLKDLLFAESLREAAILVPDGVGIVLGSRILGGKIKKRITGSDIFYELSDYINAKEGFKVFFLGSSDITLNKVIEKYKLDYPNIEIAGSLSPPFVDEFTIEENKNMVQYINICKPDILWIAMTAPKQEKWIYNNIEILNVRFAAGIGAVFDFYCGNVNRNNILLTNIGLEWFSRLIQEPKRLWKRTFISAPIFIYYILKSKVIKTLY
ncbi:WecB/TagA/CpsF family glycosyltransferase [Polynucleobacter kasalickyi]|uniref:N-acetylglucosaminyldiphosphoundecaprenol N-acetyl-beta-D-mannosaminyltransferase n=1 Tax=Polynucleobacter kasalickyi TaxID=1938817 RepID=A0A1W2C9V5_9BURK|nr:WecB/TagA/CpsF family glycosyltransferase [Polynucleobacter kasalickyi]SMC81963.1 N-acetylglucosaminyldiphosphoundecaprenol N-acetyl-beta-D-mannosaminyltransferase [Polynucleobacter kasalickyi]